MPRHGTEHGVLAPYVNYKANMMALKKAGVDQVIAISAVGSVNSDNQIGSLSLPDQLQLFSSWGMDVVGMTIATEAALARDLGICFSVVTLSTDLATGFAHIPPDLETHKRIAAENIEKVKTLVGKALSLLSEKKSCQCAKSYNEYMLVKNNRLFEVEI